MSQRSEDLLLVLIHEVQAFRAAFEAQNSRPSKQRSLTTLDREKLANLLRAISAAVGDEDSSCAKLFRAADSDADLRNALRVVGNARELGQLLLRATKARLPGNYIVERVDQRGGTAVWRVRSGNRGS